MPCVHFDFGATLRQVVDRNQPDELLSAEALLVLQKSLETGALLEGEHIDIARRLVRSFLKTQSIREPTWLVLNGLPRHVGQARALETVFDVVAVVNLDCGEQAVVERIRTNQAGDRTGRNDDYPAAIAKKLAIFRERTAPLVAYYGARMARILQLAVTAHTTPEQLWESLQQCRPEGPSLQSGRRFPGRRADCDTLKSVLLS